MIDTKLVPADRFRTAFHAAYAVHPNRDALTTPDALELDDARCYLSNDDASGYAIVAGDLRYVFSTVKGRGDELVADAIRNGARSLDCFDGYLTTLYTRHGFVVVRRVPNWTAGGPDVVYMTRP